jgi:hypothetical protein
MQQMWMGSVMSDGTKVIIMGYGILGRDVTIGVKWLGEDGKMYGRWVTGNQVAKILRAMEPQELHDYADPPETDIVHTPIEKWD